MYRRSPGSRAQAWEKKLGHPNASRILGKALDHCVYKPLHPQMKIVALGSLQVASQFHRTKWLCAR